MPAKKKSHKKRRTSKAAAPRKKTSAAARKPNRKRKSKPARKRKGTPARGVARQRSKAGASGQSGDLQGLSRRQGADSESVAELLEEGNTFEAGAVAGVEQADAAEGREVHTREVLEDDVPGEYLDRD